MKEDFLSFIWKHQYFDKDQLKTFQGEVLQVLHPGQINTHSGPDFSHARVKIGATEWAGPVEIHVRSSDWHLHRHHQDGAYDQVILHVVWVNNDHVVSSQGFEIPVLELKGRIDNDLLLNHQKLTASISTIPCGSQLGNLPTTAYTDMLDRMIRQRVNRKSREVKQSLAVHKGSWDQVTYLLLGKNFGFHINNHAFETLVRLVPLPIVRRLRPNTLQLEALYFGQAGFLHRVTGDTYYLRLQREYEFLKKKYPLPSGILKKELWKYLRLRPSNFPSLRIAQFVSMMQQQGFRFSNIRAATSPIQLTESVVKPSRYWDDHYDFGKIWPVKRSALGKSSQENLLINTAVPLLAAYGQHSGQFIFTARALEILKLIPPETNHIVAYWKEKGFEVSSAYCTQALIELNNQYCKSKKCLTCTIGQSLLTKNTRE